MMTTLGLDVTIDSEAIVGKLIVKKNRFFVCSHTENSNKHQVTVLEFDRKLRLKCWEEEEDKHTRKTKDVNVDVRKQFGEWGKLNDCVNDDDIELIRMRLLDEKEKEDEDEEEEEGEEEREDWKTFDPKDQLVRRVREGSWMKTQIVLKSQKKTQFGSLNLIAR